MKKLFNLKIPESALVIEHLNKFNIVLDQLVFIEIKFDDEICALILLASLPNSWEPMRAAVTNSIRNVKLKFVDVRNFILVKEVCRKDLGEVSSSNRLFISRIEGGTLKSIPTRVMEMEES